MAALLLDTFIATACGFRGISGLLNDCNVTDIFLVSVSLLMMFVTARTVWLSGER